MVHTPQPEVVGRDAELEVIDAFLSPHEGGSSALLLEGDAGIGKTTLWRAGLARGQELSYQVLVARPTGAESELPFAGLADLLQVRSKRSCRSCPAPSATRSKQPFSSQSPTARLRSRARSLPRCSRSFASSRAGRQSSSRSMTSNGSTHLRAAALGFVLRRAGGEHPSGFCSAGERTGTHSPTLGMEGLRDGSVERLIGPSQPWRVAPGHHVATGSVAAAARSRPHPRGLGW